MLRGLLARAAAAYLATSAIGHLLWEAAHVPLYVIWDSGTPRQIIFAVLHCTAGDVLIAAASLALALLIVGSRGLQDSHLPFTATIILSGLAYTVFSEWWNVEVALSWTYRDLMPRLPWLGTGVTPLMQWLVVPYIALRSVHRLQG